MSASLDTDLPAGTPGRTLRNLASALPDAALAVVCLLSWIAPDSVIPGVVPWILLTMLVEFIVVHSAPFMGLQLVSEQPAARKVRNVLGIGVFYSLFLFAFSYAFHAWWPFVSFWLLTLNRMSILLFRQSEPGHEREMLKASWGAGAICYLLGVGLTTFLPLPRLGLTPGFVASLHLSGGGLWIHQPWRVVAFAAFYFAALAWLEATGFAALLPRRSSAR